MLAIEEHSGDDDLHGSGCRSVTPYITSDFVLYCGWESKSLSRAFSCVQPEHSIIHRGLL
jgi:hypothetical protein